MPNTLLQKILLPLVLMSTMLTCPILAQEQKQLNSAEILAAMQRLNVVGSVLYVAAHPDDENSRLLAYLVGEKKLYATYLSLTRGDGGQNLIGTEQDEMLGLLRTYELLAARAIDGAGQLFTRARDLGYTKRADEALRQWGHEEVLSDVVLAIRRFQPDVIITRFNTLPPNHGHHTASAILAAEAFTAAADPKRFPEQLKLFQVWNSNRLLHNVTNFNQPGTPSSTHADMSMYLKLDVGGYDPLRGMSWTEIAAKSRSMHKSQGFGVAAERGPSLEYFKPLQGTLPKTDIFEGLDFSWKRFKGGEKVTKAVDLAVKGFEVTHPEKSIAALWNVHAAMKEMPDNLWKERKLAEVETLLLQCAGMVLDVRAAEATACPGDEVKLSIIALNRSGVPAKILSVELPDGVTRIDADLLKNLAVVREKSFAIHPKAVVSTPYWLYPPGMTRRPSPLLDPSLTGLPVSPAPLVATFDIRVGPRNLFVKRSIRNVSTDPVRGELSRLFEIAPIVTARLPHETIIFSDETPQPVVLNLTAAREVEVTVRPDTGWSFTPDGRQGKLVPGKSQQVIFQVTGHVGIKRSVTLDFGLWFEWPRSYPASFYSDVHVGERLWSESAINYEHVPPLTLRYAAHVKFVPLKINLGIKHIGYIPGPGDRVAESLSAIGYDVTQLPLEKLATEPLEKFEAIVVGIRAFNQTPQLAGQREKLLKYVEQGGRLLVQYQTNSRIAALSVPIGPYPLEIGRDRVTDENAEMLPLDPTDTLLQKPNLLTKEDFQGWVQERGLYFASFWDPHYRPVFAMHDQDEAPLKGGLLVAKYGKGTFIYTGLAFFRQLPAGVPGAYRLLANLLAM